MAKNNRLSNASKQYLNNFKNVSASDILADDDRLDVLDTQYEQYDDIEESEKLKQSQRKKLKNNSF